MRKRYILFVLSVIFIISSLSLFVVGREASSWRPKLVSKGGRKAARERKSQNEAAAKAQFLAVRKRFKPRPNEIFAVSPNGKWIARGGKIRGRRHGFQFEVRESTNGKLRSKIIDQGDPDSAEFSPSGDFLLIRSDVYITKCFDARTGNKLWFRVETEILLSADDNIVVHAKGASGRHGERGVTIWTSYPKTGQKIRSISTPKRHVWKLIWFDGPNHIQYGDSEDNLWRVRVR